MSVRQMTGKRATKTVSFPNRKVVPIISDASIHSFGVDDRQAISSKSFKQEKLAAGIRATNDYDYFEAVKQFALIKPDTTTSLYLGGCARLELKYYLQTQEAIADFTKCLELSSQTEEPPFSLELWYKRALAYYNINKNDHAIQDYTEFINRCRLLGEPGKSELQRGLIGRGFAYQAIYELDMALRDMNEANRLANNSNPYYVCCRASVYASKHEREKALEDLRNASDLGCDEDVEALLQRAIVLAELGRHYAALGDLTKALTLSTRPNQQSDICFRSGISEYALKNKEEAFQWFGRAVNLHPYHAQAHYHLGMIQTEKEQYKDALKTLNRAHELAPQQGDILLERAIVNQHLGKFDDAAQDRKHAMQLNSSSFAIITMLGKRIKTVREEIDRTGTSSRNHLNLAMAYDGLLTQKKDFLTQMEYYKVAVIEYRAAIETDTKHLYPQARVLFALCQQKMNDLIEAHTLHLEFYNVLAKHKGAVYHWKAYLLDVKDRMESGKLEPHLDETAVSKLIRMEFNRRKKDVDEETFQNDTEDKYNNQLIFYEQLRIDLANVLAAIAVLNLDVEGIIDNAEDTSNKVGKIVELLSKAETSIPDIESALNSSNRVNTKVLRKTDYNIVKKRLKAIGNVGDMTDQLDVAQLVARHLCTRYHSQLICLKPNNENSEDDDSIEEELSPSPWWKCCGSGNWFSSKQSTFSDGKKIFGRIATFAIASIIQAINIGTIKVSLNGKFPRKDALATALVLIVCEAHANTDTKFLLSRRYGNENLPISLTAVSKMLEKSQITKPDSVTSPVEWNLYAFFQRPGIYYYSDKDTEKIHYYGSGPLMMADTYGYRLGTREEVDVFRKIEGEEE